MVVYEQVAPKVPAGWSHFRGGYHTTEKGWVGNLKMALGQVHTDVVLLVLEDYWLYRPADAKRIWNMANWMTFDKSINKIDLTNDRFGFAHVSWDDNYIRSLPNAEYLTSVQAALWNKEYLSWCLHNPAWNPWQFELEGSKRAKLTRHKVLGCRVPAIHNINVVLKGMISEQEVARLSEEDKSALDSIGAFNAR